MSDRATTPTTKRCAAVTKAGTQCTRGQDGRGTMLCQQHHVLRFGSPTRRDGNGCVSGRPGYIGHHGHLNQ
jgi:hypothetical protein